MDEVRYASKLSSRQAHASTRFYPSRFKVLIRLTADSGPRLLNDASRSKLTFQRFAARGGSTSKAGIAAKVASTAFSKSPFQRRPRQ